MNQLAPTILLTALIAGSVGCQSLQRWWNPASGYESVGDPQLSFEEAKAICQQEAGFTASGGTAHVDWQKFERCMKPKGWVRPA
jgi:hypothetical protein